MRRTSAYLAAVAGALMTSMACSETKTIEAFPGQFAGVGLELKIEADRPVIVRTIPGGPAARAGLQPGETLIEIEGEPTRGLPLGDVIMRLRGRVDSQASVTVVRSGRPTTIVVVRRAMARAGQQAGDSDGGSAEAYHVKD